MRKIENIIMAFAAIMAIAASSVFAAPRTVDVRQPEVQQQVSKKVRHELVMLPYYGVFDNLAYKVEGDTVTLYGQVVHPSTRDDAARRVAKIAGVNHVVNNIEVLPLSSFDDEIRVRTYRRVFNMGSLYRYAMGSNPSIHIIVNRGHVTLEGVVSSEMDRRLANIAASGVPGVFSVTNNLQIDNGRRY
ncbi:MAG TPA: BON domain-containing protein [Pyrinomonadaceae bacterium]|nr:BON domain-containing protein [Pyrinomonadaceae bacterium]